MLRHAEAQEWLPDYADKQDVCINSGPLDGLPYQQAMDKAAALLAEKGLGEKHTT